MFAMLAYVVVSTLGDVLSGSGLPSAVESTEVLVSNGWMPSWCFKSSALPALKSLPAMCILCMRQLNCSLSSAAFSSITCLNRVISSQSVVRSAWRAACSASRRACTSRWLVVRSARSALFSTINFPNCVAWSAFSDATSAPCAMASRTSARTDSMCLPRSAVSDVSAQLNRSCAERFSASFLSINARSWSTSERSHATSSSRCFCSVLNWTRKSASSACNVFIMLYAPSKGCGAPIAMAPCQAPRGRATFFNRANISEQLEP
mmetsp:Transcript_113220/g.320454  ORF Transcript_113220/g.320454 Transcript_113220/m.320454 type:complete len:263 (+) Transcript_113220:148-936(+)